MEKLTEEEKEDLIQRFDQLLEERKQKDFRDYVIPFLLGCEFMVLVLIFIVVCA